MYGENTGSVWFQNWLHMAKQDKQCENWGFGQWYCWTDQEGNLHWKFIPEPLPDNNFIKKEENRI